MLAARRVPLYVLAVALVVAMGCTGSATGKGEQKPPPPPPDVRLTVRPDLVPLAPGDYQQFYAEVTVSGVPTTTAVPVDWSATGGEISSTGRYHAPAGEGTFNVTATSQGDADLKGSAVVVVSQPSSTDPTGIISLDRVTRWTPGIPGGIPHWTDEAEIIQAATYSVSGTNPSGAAAAINAALARAAAAASASTPKVVKIEAGTYRLTDAIRFDHYRYVVLRGDGPTRTKLRVDRDRTVGRAIWFNGQTNDHWNAVGYLTDVVADVPRGGTQITVANAANIQVGDILMIDQLDDGAYVYFYDGYYFKRGWDDTVGNSWNTYGPISPLGYRSVNELVEVVGKSGNVLTVSSGRRANGTPEATGTHMAFRVALHPQVWVAHTTRAGQPNTSAWCGVEDLYITGALRGVWMNNTSYSWVKNVEIDGNPWTTGIAEPPGGYTYYDTYNGSPTPNLGGSGTPIYIERSFRCEVRHSYVHHAQTINQGGSAYGIVIANGSNNLIEDNIVVYFDKCITGRTPGGGNVIGYNYVDNAFTRQRNWQEGAIDPSHNGFGHMDLVEGNWAAEMGVESTHGNAGWMTFFRNYAHGGNSGPTPVDLLNPPPGTPAPTGTVFGGQPAAMTANTHAFQATAWTREMTVVGNVLNQSIRRLSFDPEYMKTSGTERGAPIYRLGDNLWMGGTWDTGYGSDTYAGWSGRPENVRSSGASALRAEDDTRLLSYPLTVATPTFREPAWKMLYHHANWNSVNGRVIWSPGASRTLPNSLYHPQKPAFFLALDWPWVDPEGATSAARVKVLPAKARYDAGTPNG